MQGEEHSGDETKIFAAKLVGIPAFAAAFILAKYAGGNFLAPLIVGVVAYFVLLKFQPKLSPLLNFLLATQIAHVGWMAMSMFVPEGLSKIGTDLLFMNALIVWTWIRPNRASLSALVAFELLSLALNLWVMSTANEATLIPLSIHIAIRLLIVGVSVRIIWKQEYWAAKVLSGDAVS